MKGTDVVYVWQLDERIRTILIATQVSFPNLFTDNLTLTPKSKKQNWEQNIKEYFLKPL